ncbi:MAG: serine/threonine protein kinase [Candidatus Eremiobacteraeota bacterium]|nr:serine/threonine protein kinase [Candidatus Eremiobacteraeota bacterium]
MNRCWLVLLLAVWAGPGLAQERYLQLETIPPEARVTVFSPSLPTGKVEGKQLTLPAQVGSVMVRASAPGYLEHEEQLQLLSRNQQSPNSWTFTIELEPHGMLGHLRHLVRYQPWLVVLGLGGAGLFGLGYHHRQSSQRQAIEREKEALQESFDEVNPDLTGKQIDSYELLELLGEGGFAQVYKVRHLEYDDLAALKVLKEKVTDERSWRRLAREAKIGTQLDHPGVVKTLAHGTYRERPYLVMELAEGRPLDKVLERAMTPEDALTIFAELCQILAYAHGQGVIHRDLKPGNILVGPDGVKVLDFGVAQLRSDLKITAQGEVVGTPEYMSPEHIQGKPDARSDIYCLGLILYEMLTGQTAYEGSTPARVMAMHLHAPPPKARAIRPELAQEIDHLLEGLLAKRARARIQTVEEVLFRLAEIV